MYAIVSVYATTSGNDQLLRAIKDNTSNSCYKLFRFCDAAIVLSLFLNKIIDESN